MRTVSRRPDDSLLIENCHARSVELLRRNLSAGGILAASPGKRADKRGYTAIFGRDAAVCALGMALSGDKLLEDEAATGLHTLAEHQALNGQIPKFVDLHKQEADFWYLGCIDSTLWWLIALAFLDSRATTRARPGGLRRQHAKRIGLAVQWLLAQEHQRFFLLQQNEASDWADIMPRSGYVLYSNALWYDVKRRYALDHAEATRHHFNHLFNPFQRDLPEYHRARLLQHYARRGRRDPGLYLSFVNLAVVGDEGDVFGNVLAIQGGLADPAMAHRIVDTIAQAHAGEPYPVRVVLHPLTRQHALWRAYMGRHRQNLVHQYHNGGIWPFVGGFWVMALARLGAHQLAWSELVRLAQVNALDDWRFTEWFHGRTLAPMGMAGQSWNAATFLLARRALSSGEAAY